MNHGFWILDYGSWLVMDHVHHHGHGDGHGDVVEETTKTGGDAGKAVISTSIDPDGQSALVK
jgi:hypothetical protein